MKRDSIYYEFWNNGELRKTGFKILNEVQITTGIDTVPTMNLTVPISELPEGTGYNTLQVVGKETNFSTYTIRVYIYHQNELKYKFSGIVDKAELNYAGYSMAFTLSHIVARMRDWIMPSNYVVKDMPVPEVIGETQLNLGSPSTPNAVNDGNLRIQFNTYYDGDRRIETTFSSTNKLAALEEICNNTEDLHWRVELGAESISDVNGIETAQVTISSFADEGKKCLISTAPIPDDECDNIDQSEYVTMLTEPVYSVDYTNHFNRAVVFCGDVNADTLHLTLKPLYDIAEYRDNPDFPVGIYKHNINLTEETKYVDDDETNSCTTSSINNEIIYSSGKALVYANNENREFYITDTKQLAKDGGIIKQTTYNFSDLYPIPRMEETNEDCEKIEYMITDEDRLEITKRAYARGIRKLKSQRPVQQYEFNCTALPSSIKDGDKVTFYFTKRAIPYDAECEGDMKEEDIINVQERLYVTKRVITFDSVLNEYTTITLDEELRYKDVSAVEIELASKVTEGSGGDTSGAYYGEDLQYSPSVGIDITEDPLDYSNTQRDY